MKTGIWHCKCGRKLTGYIDNEKGHLDIQGPRDRHVIANLNRIHIQIKCDCGKVNEIFDNKYRMMKILYGLGFENPKPPDDFVFYSSGQRFATNIK